MIECSICNKSFVNQTTYLRHKQTKGHIMRSNVQAQNSTSLCVEPNRSFLTQTEINTMECLCSCLGSSFKQALIARHLKAMIHTMIKHMEERFCAMIDVYFNQDEPNENRLDRVVAAMLKDINEHSKYEETFLKKLSRHS